MLPIPTIPTIFAKSIAKSVNIIEDGDTDIECRLRNFQQMSITSDFELCLTSFYGIKLNEEQIEALKLIHESTKPWIKGDLVGILMQKVADNKISTQAAELIIKLMDGDLEDVADKLTQININL